MARENIFSESLLFESVDSLLDGEDRLSEAIDRADVFDPLCVERSAPLSDEEAGQIERFCRNATPGPFVVDDEVDGDAAVMAELPDGRLIVSLASSLGHAEDDDVINANAELICKARYLLLRLLRDRSKWQEDRRDMEARIQHLESLLNSGGYPR